MLLQIALAGAVALSASDTLPSPSAVGPVAEPVGIGAPSAAFDTIPSRRRKAVDISDAYALRLKIHYIASFATLPIFAAQAIVGQQLYVAENNGNAPSHSLRDTHDVIAVTLGALFVTNTVTGSWNWWETRHNPEGRAWRTVHAALMLVSDGGFAYTAWLGQNARFSHGGHNGTVVTYGTNAARNLHKNWAIGSASTALLGYIMMWKPFRKD